MGAVAVSDRDGVRTLMFDRPEALNAFTGEGYRELAEHLRAADFDSGVAVVLVTGAGRAFCVGADRGNWDPERADDVGAAFRAAALALAELSKPVLAAVNGYAVGFGATMLGLVDIVLIAEDACVRTPFTELGTVPEAGSTVTFPALLGSQRAFWMLTAGPWLSADDCVAYGLALQSCPAGDLLSVARRYADALAQADPVVVRSTKRLLGEGRLAAIRIALDRELACARSIIDGSV